ncbi:MAG: FMN-binding protein [Candidatus Limnocylindrales bacterium]
MPKRAVIAIATTALALVLLFSFKTPAGVTLADRSASPGAVAQATPGAVGPAPSSTTRVPGRTATPGTPAPTTGSGSHASGQFTGQVASTQFGPVQVQVTLANGRITDVTALQLPSDHRRSQQISSYAEPILRSEALQAQSAQIDLVSGATYTSEAYAQSLQSALDQAHG